VVSGQKSLKKEKGQRDKEKNTHYPRKTGEGRNCHLAVVERKREQGERGSRSVNGNRGPRDNQERPKRGVIHPLRQTGGVRHNLRGGKIAGFYHFERKKQTFKRGGLTISFHEQGGCHGGNQTPHTSKQARRVSRGGDSTRRNRKKGVQDRNSFERPPANIMAKRRSFTQTEKKG